MLAAPKVRGVRISHLASPLTFATGNGVSQAAQHQPQSFLAQQQPAIRSGAIPGNIQMLMSQGLNLQPAQQQFLLQFMSLPPAQQQIQFGLLMPAQQQLIVYCQQQQRFAMQMQSRMLAAANGIPGNGMNNQIMVTNDGIIRMKQVDGTPVETESPNVDM